MSSFMPKSQLNLVRFEHMVSTAHTFGHIGELGHSQKSNETKCQAQPKSCAIQSIIAKYDKWCQKRSQTTNSHLIDTIDTKNSRFDNPINCKIHQNGYESARNLVSQVVSLI